MFKTLKGNIKIDVEEDEEDTSEEDSFWSKGAFIESMGPNDARMRTFHMGHDEEMEHSCRKCKVKISAHNKDWHDGMCDGCFDGEYFKDGLQNK